MAGRDDQLFWLRCTFLFHRLVHTFDADEVAGQVERLPGKDSTELARTDARQFYRTHQQLIGVAPCLVASFEWPSALAIVLWGWGESA